MPLNDKDRETLLSRITKPAPGKNFKAVLYGVPSTGKTTTAAALGDKNLIVMTETGDSVLTKPEHKHLYDRTDRVPFVSLGGLKGYAEMMRDGTVEYDHLIVDNMSGIQDKKLSENHGDARVQKLSRAHPDLSVLQDYQIIANQMRPVIVDLLELEKNVTIICHFRPSNPETQEYEARPDLTKAIWNLVNEKADVVAYFYKNKAGDRFAQTLGDSRFQAKSRIIPEANMSLEKFVTLMNDYRNSL